MDGSQPEPALNVRQLYADLLSCNLIQSADRLIQKQNFWLQNKSPRQSNTLFFTTTETVDSA